MQTAKKTSGRTGMWLAVAAGLLLAGSIAHTAGAWDGTRTWDGTTGEWSEAAKWSPSGVPGDGENVILPSGTYTLYIGASSANLTAYTQNGGTLCFSNWTTSLKATDVTIAGGKVECLVCDTNAAPDNTNRVWIIANNLTVGASGSINVNSKGFRGGVGNAGGQGPGGGPDPASGGYARGGGYGGLGGASYYDTGGPRGLIYGEAGGPVLPGSGGSARGGTEGGAGGGAVRLEVTGSLTVHGAITANGGLSTAGGSGGGIYITCSTVAGNGGIVEARGANHNGLSGGGIGTGGGGGRVAIVYDPVAQSALSKPVIRFSAAHGCADPYYNQTSSRNGTFGTMFFTDWQLLQLTISYPVSGQFISGSSSTGITEQLTITSSNRVWIGPYGPNDADNTWVSFPGLRQLTVSNQAAIVNGARLDIDNCVMNVGGGLTVTNNAKFYVTAGETNSGTAAYGSLVAVTNGVLIANGSWVTPVSHLANGGSVLFRVGSLNIATTNAGFNADSMGYGSHTQFVDGSQAYGPGRGGNRGGGGYGGKGGSYAPGSSYGSSNAPAQCGSGGGGSQVLSIAGWGGGLVWIEASGAVNVEGSILARGQSMEAYQGCGSGGGIFIRCGAFSGSTTAILNANGGNSAGNSGTDGGTGGGGRIAVWYKPVSEYNAQKIMAGQLSQVAGPLLISTNIPAYLGAVSAAAGTGGSGTPSYQAAAGSVVFLAIGNPMGTLMIVK